MADAEENEQTHVLIEIISCWKLLKGDFRSSDPYVKVKLGGKDVHKTKYMEKTLDPVFTVKHDSTFVLEESRLELEKHGLTFKVKDYDKTGSDDLGSVVVPADQILKADDTRMEFAFAHPKGKKKEAGFIAIKCRPATDSDEKFLSQVKEADKSKKSGFGIKSAFSGLGSSTVGGIFKQNKVKDSDTGVTSYRIRPGPDPEFPKATEWMSKKQIETESLKPSKKWLDLGSGELAKVYLEVIGCDGLEDKDGGLQKSNKTDSFCTLVYEDCMATTDCVDDCLSPRLLPWMKRAFILRMEHTSSPLNIAVFDSDTGPLSKHQTIGKVSINLANFKPRTEYLLYYNLYESGKIGNREPKGVLKIRMRIQYNSQRKAIMSSLGAPPKITVNVDNSSDYRLIRKTIQGKNDVRKYDIDTIKSYVDELKTYQQATFFIQDALTNILFWRGTYPVSLPFVPTFYLPLHSTTAFVMAVFLVEKPRLLPSFFFFGIAWFMCAVMWFKHYTPDPWFRCKSFGDFFIALILGYQSADEIEAHENEEKAIASKEEWDQRVKAAEEAAAKAAEEAAKAAEAEEEILKEFGENAAGEGEETEGRKGFPKISILKPILFPIQQNLALVCQYVRVVRNVIIWEESYYSFWITFVSLVLGIVFVFLPWVFLLKWLLRIIVWTFLGPWMFFVDKCYLQKKKPLTEEQEEKREEKLEKEKSEGREEMADELRRQREEDLKAKDMKAALYGKYETTVPAVQSDRYIDYPLHSSSATKYHCDEDDIQAVERIGGQEIPVPGETTPLIPKQE